MSIVIVSTAKPLVRKEMIQNGQAVPYAEPVCVRCVCAFVVLWRVFMILVWLSLILVINCYHCTCVRVYVGTGIKSSDSIRHWMCEYACTFV